MPDSKCGFGCLVVGNSNQQAYEAARKVSDRPGDCHNPLIVWGPDGVGKTILLAAIKARAEGVMKRVSALHVTSEALSSDIVSAVMQQTGIGYVKAKQIREKYLKADFLLIDDVHFLEWKAATLGGIVQILDSCYEKKKQIVLTSERPPNDIPRIMGPIELHYGGTVLITELQVPDMAMRMEFIRLKSCTEGLRLTDAVAKLIASSADNFRVIEGCLIKLGAHFVLSGNTANLDTARLLLKDLLPEGKVER